MNKYQEALNEIMKAYWTLKELVDISSKPTIIYGDETTCVVNLEQIDKLEKALDKACALLAKWQPHSVYTGDQWKDAMIKQVENEN